MTIFLMGTLSFRSLYSQDVSSGALFLDLPHNVHQHALGEAADLEGLKSINTNPAGTNIRDAGSQDSLHSGLNFAQYPGGLLFTNILLLYWFRDEIGTFGLAVVYLDYGKIPNIDTAGNELGNISAYDIYAGLNYSRKIFGDILIGVNAKIIQQKLHTFSATGFAGDIGLKRKFGIFKNDLWVSLSGNHLGPPLKFDQENTPLPSRIHLSTSYVMKSWFPKWFYIKFGPQFNYFLENYMTFTIASGFFFDLGYFNLYALTKYRLGSGTGQYAVGTGGTYKADSYQIDLSFGINPIAFSNDLIASITFVYNFTQKKLSRVKPIDFSADLKISDPAELGKDPGEIIIKLDDPIEGADKETTKKKKGGDQKNIE